MLAGHKPTGLYGWIRSNDGRSLGLFLGFLIAVQLLAAPTLFLPLVVFDQDHAPVLAWGGYFARYVPAVAVLSVLWFVWKYWWHIESVKKAVGFRFIDAREEPYLCQVIEPLIVMWGLPVPFVGVIDSPARNAFACGIGRKKAVVVVTRGLIEDLTRDELECVLAHELSHIKNNDIRLMAAANIFMGALTDMKRNNPMQLTWVHVLMAIAVPAMLPITLVATFLGHMALRAGQMSRLMIASKREYIADAEAVSLTKNPGAMAAALVKVEHAYAVEGARTEDDAMMIAGDTDGANATHPTVAQRIAALARTTGSLVFTGPHSPSAEAFRDNPSLSQAQAAALMRQLPPDRVAERVAKRSRTNWLGLDTKGAVLAVITIGALIGLHYEEVRNPRMLAAKFDARPIGVILGTSFACGLAPGIGKDCDQAKGAKGYAQFEGQKNTLAGWLADKAKANAAKGGDSALTLEALNVEIAPYRGQSGRLTGQTARYANGRTNLFAEAGGKVTSKVPEALVIAEIEQVGCFPATLADEDPGGKFRIDQVNFDGNGIDRFEKSALASLVADGMPGSKDYDIWLRKYVAARETSIAFAYSQWGLAGLERMRTAYSEPAHAAMLAKLAARMEDPAFVAGFDPVGRAKVASLLARPDAYLPCPILPHLPAS